MKLEANNSKMWLFGCNERFCLQKQKEKGKRTDKNEQNLNDFPF